MRTQWVVVSLLCLLLASPAWTATIIDAALGSQLAGGIVTVTRFGGPMSSATFAAVGTGASAIAPGSGGFSLTVGAGDTSSATWTLTNTDPSSIFLNNIVSVVIDLTFSGISLFDSGSLPSTPFSGPGVDGATYVAGVAFSGDTNILSWSDAANTGDMYYALSIVFSGPFTADLSSSWTTDTDLIAAVPEPGAFIPTCLILLLAVSRFVGRRAST